eukprot:GILJ01007671.1.p1 GENE.GILJ01007671.1~~GILJ01007671.1.p1  ORF type:complete len:339 (+),score=55.75 GILJ01007671.1:48-1019(+)
MEVLSNIAPASNVGSLRIDIRRAFYSSTMKCMVYDIAITTPLKAWRIEHRYKDFCQLHEDLKRSIEKCQLPYLPPKKLWGNMDPAFITRRLKKLDTYLKALVVVEPVVRHDVFHRFIAWNQNINLTPDQVVSADVSPLREAKRDSMGSLYSATSDIYDAAAVAKLLQDQRESITAEMNAAHASRSSSVANGSGVDSNQVGVEIHNNSNKPLDAASIMEEDPADVALLDSLSSSYMSATLLRVQKVTEKHKTNIDDFHNLHKNVAECNTTLVNLQDRWENLARRQSHLNIKLTDFKKVVHQQRSRRNTVIEDEQTVSGDTQQGV